MNVVEMKCLRSIASVTRRDRIMNEIISLRTGVKPEMTCKMDRGLLKWFGCIEGWMKLAWRKE